MTGGLRLLDPPAGGWWNEPPAMANAAGMLVSTLDDFWAFVSMIVAQREARRPAAAVAGGGRGDDP